MIGLDWDRAQVRLWTTTRAGWDLEVQEQGSLQREAAVAAKGGADRAVGLKVTVPW